MVADGEEEQAGGGGREAEEEEVEAESGEEEEASGEEEEEDADDEASDEEESDSDGDDSASTVSSSSSSSSLIEAGNEIDADVLALESHLDDHGEEEETKEDCPDFAFWSDTSDDDDDAFDLAQFDDVNWVDVFKADLDDDEKIEVFGEYSLPHLRMLLEEEPDFVAQKNQVEELLERLGHRFLLLVKMHPETSWQEYRWCMSKHQTRRRKVLDAESLRAGIKETLDDISCLAMQRMGQRVREYIRAYAAGANGANVDSRRAVFKSHRGVVMASLVSSPDKN